MRLGRKDFLKGLGVAALGATSASVMDAARPAPADRPRGLLPFESKNPAPFWNRVRDLYARRDDFAYLNSGGLGPASRPVLEKYDQVTADLDLKVETGHAMHEPARKVAAEFFGVTPEEVCFVRNTTEGNSIVACGLNMKAGDEVIFESHAHPGGSIPWLNRAHRQGIVVRTFEPDPSSAAGNLERISALMTPRTKVIQISHVTAPTGIVMPVKAIAKLAREKGCWFHVDGAQSGGMLNFSLRDIGCDSYATSGHKWIGAPRETGLLFIGRDRIDEVAPTFVGASTSDD
ncbi:MAG TPA: aminotransferase class V-fold PLP-dependent enzyme, partial [Opitutaceae bacterium]|nr:aminotransferase class V-fold PLP-dependent enzyme [Opitutaceae bacterium]